MLRRILTVRPGGLLPGIPQGVPVVILPHVDGVGTAVRGDLIGFRHIRNNVPRVIHPEQAGKQIPDHRQRGFIRGKLGIQALRICVQRIAEQIAGTGAPVLFTAPQHRGCRQQQTKEPCRNSLVQCFPSPSISPFCKRAQKRSDIRSSIIAYFTSHSKSRRLCKKRQSLCN